MLNGTPNEFITVNGVPVPVKAQYLFYPFWGSERTFPHFAAPGIWARHTAGEARLQPRRTPMRPGPSAFWGGPQFRGVFDRIR